MQPLKEHFKLYQAKKQGLVWGASLLLALSAGIVAHADVTSTTTMTSDSTQQVIVPVSELPATTVEEPANPQPTVTTNNTGNAETVATPSTNLASSTTDHQSTQAPIQSQSRDTTTSFGSQIDPNSYTVTINVSGLTYQIPPYKLQGGDLRFATDEEVSHLTSWHQPALVNGQAVNVGTYLVFLSQTGYDNLTVWINGRWDNDTWVLQPGVHNIELPAYSLDTLLQMGTSTYTIDPYQLKLQVTWSAPLTNNGLDYSKYSIVLQSGASGQTSVNDYQDSFNQLFHWTPGDLQVSPTASADGTYQVSLTAQGWQNVLTALQKVFNSYGNVDHQANFACDPATDLSSIATATKAADYHQATTPGQQPGTTNGQPGSSATNNPVNTGRNTTAMDNRAVQDNTASVAQRAHSDQQLPQTGDRHQTVAIVLGALVAMLGLGFAAQRRHQ